MLEKEIFGKQSGSGKYTCEQIKALFKKNQKQIPSKRGLLHVKGK